MDSLDLYTMPSSPSFFTLLGEDEQEDFTLGAKPTSFLHPATFTHTETNVTPTYDLPEWMEGREMVGFASHNLPPTTHGTTTFNINMDTNLIPLDDNCLTIKPEDMLVPLSEYQSPSSSPLAPSVTLPTSPAKSLTPLSANSAVLTTPITPVSTTPTLPLPTSYVSLPSPPLTPPPPLLQTSIATPTTTQVLPKIIICRKVTAPTRKTKPVKMQFQIKPVEKMPKVAPEPPQAMNKPKEERTNDLSVVAKEEIKTNPFDAIPESHVRESNAEEFIDELVKMIGDSGGNGLEALDNLTFDESEMEVCMEDLLTQLETSEPGPESSTTFTAAPSCPQSVVSESTSLSLPSTSYPAPSPSPNPSIFTSPASPPPQSLSPASLPSLSPFPISPLSPAPSETPSSAYLLSPVPSVGSLSPSQSSDSFFSVEEEWSPLEETRSSSKSRKAKSSRRASGGRRTPYPEDRKERKKEQNKQAALRYRQKKKLEEDEMSEKIREEEERQRELRGKYEGLKQELGYLKKIMREVFVARGLVSEEALKKAAMEKRRKN